MVCWVRSWHRHGLQGPVDAVPISTPGSQIDSGSPSAGTGRTGYVSVPPNNYPFYSEDEKYVPIVQADGGQLSGAYAWAWGDGSPGSSVRGGLGLVRWSSAQCIVDWRLDAGTLVPHSSRIARAEWKPMYNPTAEQAEKDRQAAYEAGVPHGFVAPGDKHAGQATITLPVLSELVRRGVLKVSCLL